MVAVNMDAPVTTPKLFRIGTVLVKSVRIFTRNFSYISPTFLVALSTIQAADFIFNSYIPMGANVELTPSQVVLAIFGISAYFIIYVIGVSITVHAVFQHLREGRPRIGDILSRGLARAPQMIGVGILVLFAMLAVVAVFGGILGIMTFNVWPMADLTDDGMPIASTDQLRLAAVGVLGSLPALFLIVIWYVSSAALAAEDLAPIRALERSRKLSKGFRWRILALAVICGCLALLPLGALVFIAPFIWTMPWLIILLWIALSAFTHAYMWVIPCAAFVELRQAKEGKDIQKISDVFD